MKNAILEIIYEDEDMIIINKAADVLTIPHRFDNSQDSVYGALNRQFGKVFIVHRLDKETSGILCFAKNEAAHRHLSMQFEEKSAQKIYYALLDGVMHTEEGEINKPISEHHSVAGKMMVGGRTGKASLTLFKVVERFKHYTLVEADLKTGRTHQIRVHFQSIGYPLAVDAMYGRKPALFLSEIKSNRFKLGKFEEEQPILGRTALHAFRLTLLHPSTNRQLIFEAEPPKDFRATLQQLRRWGQ